MTTHDNQARKVFILGSCVSRDAFESVPHQFEVACYLARTSLASIGMAAVTDGEVRSSVEKLPSPFQRRMLLNDLDKTTLSVIAETPHDVLLLDFVDERFNLVSSESTFFSLSGELQKSGLDVSSRSLIEPQSEVFLKLWIAGLERLLSSIDETKVVLNRVYWAEYFPDGKDASSKGWIHRSNVQLQRLYDAVDKRWSLRSIEYPDEVVVADPQHQWGPAPYHYVEAFYRNTLASLDSFVGAACLPKPISSNNVAAPP